MRDKAWPIDKWPAGCRACHRLDKNHEARGFCVTDYKKRNTPAFANDVDLATYGSWARVEPVEPVVDAVGADFNPFASDLDEKFPGGEVRPGVGDANASPSIGPSPGSGVDDEPSPRIRSRSFVDRALGRKKPVTGPVTPPPPKTNETRPGGGSTPRRRSLADDLEQIIGTIGARMTRLANQAIPVSHFNPPLGKHYSLGQYIQWQGPATAQVIDDNVAGTKLDEKVLQPAARGKDRIGAIAGVLAPPFLIYMIEANPALFDQLKPALSLAIETSLDSLLPAKKKAEARAAKRRAVIRDAYGEDLGPDVDIVEDMIKNIFPWAYETPTQGDHDVAHVG